MRTVVHVYSHRRRVSRDAPSELREKTGTLVASGGKWYYRKPNDVVRYGPYNSPEEAATEARRVGVTVDSEASEFLKGLSSALLGDEQHEAGCDCSDCMDRPHKDAIVAIA